MKHAEDTFTGNFSKIYWCVPDGGEAPDEVKEDPNIEVLTGWPDGRSLAEGSLCVVDDLQSEIGREALLLFTFHSSHRKVTLICLNHCLFPKNKYQRVITQSTSSSVIFLTPRDTYTFYRFANQLEPHRAKLLYNSYLDACSHPYGFIVCDLTPGIHPALKYRSFPVSGVPGHGACIYTTEDDINSLMSEDPRYARFSGTIPAPLETPCELKQKEEGANREHSDQTGSELSSGSGTERDSRRGESTRERGDGSTLPAGEERR